MKIFVFVKNDEEKITTFNRKKTGLDQDKLFYLNETKRIQFNL